MNKHDDYIAGAHDYWTHFWCGLVFGAISGALIGWRIFDSGWAIAATAISASLVTALICGNWGDQGWWWVLQFILN